MYFSFIFSGVCVCVVVSYVCINAHVCVRDCRGLWLVLGVLLRDSVSLIESRAYHLDSSGTPEYFCLISWTLGSQVDIVPTWLLTWTLKIWTLVFTCIRSALPAAPASLPSNLHSSVAFLLSFVLKCSLIVIGISLSCFFYEVSWNIYEMILDTFLLMISSIILFRT